jgi:hypothetical protein
MKPSNYGSSEPRVAGSSPSGCVEGRQTLDALAGGLVIDSFYAMRIYQFIGES